MMVVILLHPYYEPLLYFVRFVHVTLVFPQYAYTIQHFAAIGKKKRVPIQNAALLPINAPTHAHTPALSFCCTTRGS